VKFVFFPLEIKKTTSFCYNFQIPGGQRPPALLSTPMAGIEFVSHLLRCNVVKFVYHSAAWKHAPRFQIQTGLQFRKVDPFTDV